MKHWYKILRIPPTRRNCWCVSKMKLPGNLVNVYFCVVVQSRSKRERKRIREKRLDGILAESRQNLQNHMCAPLRRRSTCADAQSDEVYPWCDMGSQGLKAFSRVQRLLWQDFTRSAITLIRRCGCACWWDSAGRSCDFVGLVVFRLIFVTIQKTDWLTSIWFKPTWRYFELYEQAFWLLKKYCLNPKNQTAPEKLL